MQQNELESLKSTCLYSIPPSKLGYCGPNHGWKALQEFASNPAEEKATQTKNILQHFNALYPYLQLIAEANSLLPFDLAVIEAYWLGNHLLKNVPHKAIQETILSFQKHGLPSSIAEKKASLLPEGMPPSHAMHVLYINFISQKVPALIQNLSNCLVQWGRIQETLPQGITIKGIELISESNQLKIREKTKTVENPFSLSPKPDDLITVHWENAIEVISTEQKKSLQKFTEKTLACLRPQNPISDQFSSSLP
jgi:hypothetical protein